MARQTRHEPNVEEGEAQGTDTPLVRAPIPVTAIESIRTLPMASCGFDSAKFVQVMDGEARVETALGTY